jgi:hypothetical protein
LTETVPPATSGVLTSISGEIARIYARDHSHAPAGVKTVWSEDVLVCVLDGVLTDDERQVRAYMTEVGPEDVSSEVFVLASA